MNLQQMQLSESALGKLSQLALVVELHERQRFSLRKDINHVVKLLTVAGESANTIVQDKLSELSGSLNADALGFFRTLGVDLGEVAEVRKSKRTYRGRVVSQEVAPAAVAPEPKVDNSKKKKVIYRGQVTYR